jgi:2-dehydropantoate 2-reductase
VIHIVGAGAIGSFLAARFALAGFDVELVARGSRLDEVRRSGVRITSGAGILNIPVNAQSNPEGMSLPDMVIFCVKAQNLIEALEQYAFAADDPPVFVTVQNGVDAPQLALARFPDATILAARVHGFFEMEGAVVRHVGVEPSFSFGLYNKCSSNAADGLLHCLQRSGIAASLSKDIKVDLWTKFLLASALGGVGAALRLPAGQLQNDAVGRVLLKGAMQEIATLAKSHGVRLPDDIVTATLKFVSTFPSDATTSLQRDLDAGRCSEFDHLTGAVLRMAANAGLALPVHKDISIRLAQQGIKGAVA